MDSRPVVHLTVRSNSEVTVRPSSRDGFVTLTLVSDDDRTIKMRLPNGIAEALGAALSGGGWPTQFDLDDPRILALVAAAVKMQFLSSGPNFVGQGERQEQVARLRERIHADWDGAHVTALGVVSALKVADEVLAEDDAVEGPDNG